MRLRTGIGIVLILMALYGLIKAWPVLSGPQISLTTLATSPSGLTIVSGTAIHTETLTLNGDTLLIDGEGFFSKSLTLPRGGVILTLTATDRFKRERTETRAVIIP